MKERFYIVTRETIEIKVEHGCWNCPNRQAAGCNQTGRSCLSILISTLEGVVCEINQTFSSLWIPALADTVYCCICHLPIERVTIALIGNNNANFSYYLRGGFPYCILGKWKVDLFKLWLALVLCFVNVSFNLSLLGTDSSVALFSCDRQVVSQTTKKRSAIQTRALM